MAIPCLSMENKGSKQRHRAHFGHAGPCHTQVMFELLMVWRSDMVSAGICYCGGSVCHASLCHATQVKDFSLQLGGYPQILL